MVRYISLQREANEAVELSELRNNGYAKKPSSLWESIHTLGRLHLCLLTTHVRMVARSWSCMGTEPAAMLKTMLSTGSKVANSSLVGAAPAIKYHWPRWGSGNWRWGEQKVGLTTESIQPLHQSGWQYLGLPFSNLGGGSDPFSDFSSLSLLSKPHPPILPCLPIDGHSTNVFSMFLLSSQHSHPLPPFLSSHSKPLTLFPRSHPTTAPCKASQILSSYLFPIHSSSCQLTVLRALVDGVKENAIEVE